MPRQPPKPGLVVTSTRTMPASWYSAENEFVLNRICWIWSFGGSRPPPKPSTKIWAPGPAIICSCSAISSGSSDSPVISSSVSFVSKPLSRWFDVSDSETTTSSMMPIASCSVVAFAPRRTVIGRPSSRKPSALAFTW